MRAEDRERAVVELTARMTSAAENEAQLQKLYESVKAIAPNVVVQEYHPGVEDHVQVLMHEGEAFMVGDYIGEHHMPLAGGVTVQRVSCRHEGLIRDAVRLLKALGKRGLKPHDVPLPQTILLFEQPKRLAHDLTLVVVEPRRDLLLDEPLQFRGEVDAHVGILFH